MRTILCSLLLVTTFADPLSAFNTPTHHQILKSALAYLRTHVSQSDQTDEWLRLAQKLESETNLDPLERLLVRSIIDTDYQDDLWMDSWYLKPISAGKTNVLGMLTSLYHFTNVTKPGQHWQYDGYAYQNTNGLGNDAYIGQMSLVLRADLSKPFQKYASDQKNTDMATVYLPPSYLIAKDAFDDAVSSWPSMKNVRETWDKEIIFSQSYILNSWIYHRYAREEIAGLPSNLQKLGVAMHMAQDLAMPHHSQGIAGLCHSDFETFVDKMTCEEDIQVPSDLYDSGIFDETPVLACQELNNINRIEQLVAHNPIFNIHSGLGIKERLIGIAKLSAETKVQPTPDHNDNSMLVSINDKVLFSNSCEAMNLSAEMKQVAKRQYEIATAATIMLIELAAMEYKKQMGEIADNQIPQCIDKPITHKRAETFAYTSITN